MISTSGAPSGVLVALYNTRALTTLSYVAQFSLPPDMIYPRERALLGRLLHFPGNAMASSDVFSLRRWGSYDINSLLAMSLAILMRAALVTLSTWPSMLEHLKSNDVEHLNIVKGVVKSRFKPKHWDTASIAELLRDASLGFPDSIRFRAAGQLALSAFRRERSTSKRFPKGIQTVFYNIFLDTLFFDSIPKLITKRLRVLDPGVPLPPSVDFVALRGAIRAYPHHVILTIVRSWANGWTTTHRMHEPHPLQCFFGCPGCKDDLQHYLRCDRLWRALKSVLKRTATSISFPLFAATISDKLAITRTTANRVLELCAITHSYYVLKNCYFSRLVVNYQTRNMIDTANVTLDVVKSAVVRFLAMFDLPSSGERPPVLSEDAFPVAEHSFDETGLSAVAASVLPVGVSLPSATDPFGRVEAPSGADTANISASLPPATDPLGRVRGQSGADNRDACEPECSELPAGQHHPACSSAALLHESRGYDMSAGI